MTAMARRYGMHTLQDKGPWKRRCRITAISWSTCMVLGGNRCGQLTHAALRRLPPLHPRRLDLVQDLVHLCHLDLVCSCVLALLLTTQAP